MEHRTLLIGLVALVTGACGAHEDAGGPAPGTDPRVGDEGLLRFNGGGCNSSTNMAVGSRVVLEVAPLDGSPPPADMSFLATAPDIIDAHGDDVPGEVLLEAHASGASTVEVLSAGAMLDRLTFTAEPARAVRFEAVPRVFESGAVDVVIREVFGACGDEDCPLLGHGFLSWRSDPPEAFRLIEDVGGTASFRSTASGMLLASEPVFAEDLVGTQVEVVPRDGVTGWTATATSLPLIASEDPRSFELPGEVAAGEIFCVQLSAERGDQPSVPLSRRDIVWHVDGTSVVAVPTEHTSEPLGTVFIAIESGEVSLSASSPLFDMGDDARFVLRVGS